MKTVTSTAGHIRSAVYTLSEQLAKIERQENAIIIAKRIVAMWDNGCSFGELAAPMTDLAIALRKLNEVGK